VSIIVCYPQSITTQIPKRQRDLFIRYATADGFFKDAKPLDGNGFVGIDAATTHTDAEIANFIERFVSTNVRESFIHPDTWDPALIRDPPDTAAKLTAVAGDKYSYNQLAQYSDLIKRTLLGVTSVSRVSQVGTLDEKIVLEYSQERLASYGLQPVNLRERLPAQNIAMPAGVIEVNGKNLRVAPSGAFRTADDIGNVAVAASPDGSPIYLRQLVDISRDYDMPPRFLNFVVAKDDKGNWQRTRSVTLSVYMRKHEHIDKFGREVDETLKHLERRLPDDLVIRRTSDQPLQVEDNLELFMTSLYEAVILVVITALIGFWEWRSALLMALCIPTTLCMTFGMMYLLGIDVQQVSVASLIIALGLLVDDPVVAGDAIKKCLAEGFPREVAAWLGPTKLGRAIMFATLTNIAAYLPLLMLSGLTGQFIFTLPIVITCSLVASRIVSMTFVPLLAYYLLRREDKPIKAGGWRENAVRAYFGIGNKILDHRFLVWGASLAILFAGLFFSLNSIKQQFFPQDQMYLAWVDVWTPEDAPLLMTNEATQHAEKVIQKVVDDYGRQHPDKDGKPREVMDSITVYLGGASPRFWDTMLPEMDQLNYAQLVLKFKDKHETDQLLPLLQRALSSSVAEAMCDVRALESGEPIGIPVQLRVSGTDPEKLRQLAKKLSVILRNSPLCERTRDDWGAGGLTLKLDINADRANLVGLTNADIAGATLSGVSGYQVDVLREGDKQIPIVARMRQEETAQLNNLKDLYVYSTRSSSKVPLREVASLSFGMNSEKIRRRNQFRTITVAAFPVKGVLASEVMTAIRPQLEAFQKEVPPGYKLDIGGEEEEQSKSFDELTGIMATSIIAIFLCLVFQFKDAMKPMLVFAGLPYGLLGALVGLTVMGQPFGFPAFMGVASLAGIIVSHVIVLFDIIEEKREAGEPIREALLDGVLARLRPVLITVAATVFGLFPLAAHGGPLWQPMCYSQIGGLTAATLNTLLLVPVLYAISVLDFKVIRWDVKPAAPLEEPEPELEPASTQT
jgi:multidrug efflux pump subunit AcrB